MSFKCPQCNKTFRRAIGRTNHVNRYHRARTPTSSATIPEMGPDTPVSIAVLSPPATLDFTRSESPRDTSPSCPLSQVLDKFEVFQQQIREEADEDLRILQATTDQSLQHNTAILEAWAKTTSEGLSRRFDEFVKDQSTGLAILKHTEATAHHALRTARTNRDQLRHVDQQLGVQSSRCSEWMAGVDETLKHRLASIALAHEEVGSTSSVERRLGVLEGLVKSIAAHAKAMEGGMQQHTEDVTKWRQTVDENISREFQSELEPLSTDLGVVSRKLSMYYDQQQLINSRIIDLEAKLVPAVSGTKSLKLRFKGQSSQ